jgi:hypothetical protein
MFAFREIEIVIRILGAGTKLGVSKKWFKKKGRRVLYNENIFHLIKIINIACFRVKT